MLNKTPLLHQSFGPRVFLSLSLSPSLSLSGWSPGAQRPSGFTFLPGLLRPSREGTLRLHPIERVPEASVNRASPRSGTLLACCINQGISASFSLLYFLIGWFQTTKFWSIKGPQHWSLLKVMSTVSVMPSNHLILCHLFLLPPSIFPSIGIFSNGSALRIRWPKYWNFSFSIRLPMNIQDWFPLEWTSWIPLQSKGLSRVFSNTTVRKHQFFAQLSYGLISIHDCWGPLMDQNLVVWSWPIRK